jgi:hypothetical protein
LGSLERNKRDLSCRGPGYGDWLRAVGSPDVTVACELPFISSLFTRSWIICQYDGVVHRSDRKRWFAPERSDQMASPELHNKMMPMTSWLVHLHV